LITYSHSSTNPEEVLKIGVADCDITSMTAMILK